MDLELADRDGAAGTFPSKRLIIAGSSPTSAAIASVDGAQRYSPNAAGSALIGRTGYGGTTSRVGLVSA